MLQGMKGVYHMELISFAVETWEALSIREQKLITAVGLIAFSVHMVNMSIKGPK